MALVLLCRCCMSLLSHIFHAPFGTTVIAFNHINHVPLSGFYILEIIGNRPAEHQLRGPYSETEAVANCQQIVKQLITMDRDAEAVPSDLEL